MNAKISGQMSKNVWEGVFPDLGTVPTKGDGFGGQRWLDSLERRHQQAVEGASLYTDQLPHYSESLLPVIIATQRASQEEPVTVLDYGGATGAALHRTRISGCRRVHFTIKEVPAVCALGRKLWCGDPHIRFVETMPNERFDIVHLGSTLQYEADWKEAMAECADAASSRLLLTDVHAGPQPTFATGQLYYDSVLPSWFFNLDEVVNVAESKGFQTTFRAAFDTKIRGSEGLPLANFPMEFREIKSYHLMFERP